MDYNIEDLRALRDETKAAHKEMLVKRGQRQIEIARLHLVENKSYAEIGRQYGISRQRVHQIITRL